MKIVIYTVLALLALLIVGYGGAIVLPDPLAGKDNEMAVIETAFQEMGLDEPTWQTIVIAASQETELSRDQVWATWRELENWPTWSQPLHESAKWTGTADWQVGASFEQVLNSGFPLGTLVSNETLTVAVPGEQIMWCKNENGIHSCHIWQFDELPGGGTKITNVEVFDGASIGLMKPLLTNNMQQLFASSVDGLIQQSK